MEAKTLLKNLNCCQKVRKTCQDVINNSTKKLVQINEDKIDKLVLEIKPINNIVYDKWSDWHI